MNESRTKDSAASLGGAKMLAFSVEAEPQNKAKITIKRTRLIPCDRKFNKSIGISPNNLQLLKSVNVCSSSRKSITTGETVIKKINIDAKVFRLKNYLTDKTVPNEYISAVFGRSNALVLLSALETVPDDKLRQQALSILSAPNNKTIADSTSQTDSLNFRSVFVQTESDLDCSCQLMNLDTEMKKLKRRRIMKRKHNLKVPCALPSIKSNRQSEELKEQFDTESNQDLPSMSPAHSSVPAPTSAPPLTSSPTPALSMMLTPSIFQSVDCRSVSNVSDIGNLPSDVSLCEAMVLGDAVEQYASNTEPLRHNEKLSQFLPLEVNEAKTIPILHYFQNACMKLKMDLIRFRQYENGYLPVHYAVIDDNVSELQRQCIILKHNVMSIDLPDQTEEGKTPLLICVSGSKSYECLDILLENKSHPLECDSASNNALHYAVEHEDSMYTCKILFYMSKNTQSLLDYWKEVLKSANSQVPEVPNILRTLLHAGLSAYNDDGFTPLMVAARHGKNHNLLCLLEKLSDSDENEISAREWLKSIVNMPAERDGRTSIYIAVEFGIKYHNIPDEYIACIKILMQYGADPEVRTNYGLSLSDLIKTSPHKNQLSFIPNLMKKKSYIEESDDDEFFKIAYEKVSKPPPTSKYVDNVPQKSSGKRSLDDVRKARNKNKKKNDKKKRKGKKNKYSAPQNGKVKIKLELFDDNLFSTVGKDVKLDTGNESELLKNGPSMTDEDLCSAVENDATLDAKSGLFITRNSPPKSTDDDLCSTVENDATLDTKSGLFPPKNRPPKMTHVSEQANFVSIQSPKQSLRILFNSPNGQTQKQILPIKLMKGATEVVPSGIVRQNSNAPAPNQCMMFTNSNGTRTVKVPFLSRLTLPNAESHKSNISDVKRPSQNRLPQSKADPKNFKGN